MCRTAGAESAMAPSLSKPFAEAALNISVTPCANEHEGTENAQARDRDIKRFFASQFIR
jgi:hypothetical protein